ncbi:MAG: flagellar hook-basal body complex protein FliE [Pseudomonadota bacterium]
MEINSFNAAKAYGAAQKTLGTETRSNASQSQSGDGGEFTAAADTVRSVANAVSSGEQAAANYMVGKADPHSVVEALASAEIAVETAVTLRDRVVEAYQELMRMPV